MDFEIVGKIQGVEQIAKRSAVRERTRLRKRYGQARWRKMKGFATVRLLDGTLHQAEVHWYEGHGVGGKEYKIKFPLLDES